MIFSIKNKSKSDCSEAIIVVELQCCGIEHAMCNAALIYTIYLTSLFKRISFFAEKEHLDYVKNELRNLGIVNLIDCFVINIPNRKLIGYKRLLIEVIICNHLYSLASGQKGTKMIFCSATGTCLFAIKVLMLLKYRRTYTLVTIHSYLSTLLKKQNWKSFLCLKNVLSIPHPANLYLIALSESIMQNIQKLKLKNNTKWKVLPLAYFWTTENSLIELPVHEYKFCFLGTGGADKGLLTFCNLADDISISCFNAKFVVAGFYSGDVNKKPFSEYIPAISNYPLEKGVYNKIVANSNYVVSTSNPEHYKLTASATFLDALSFLKPGIYLKNDYIEYWFKKLGDIGYLCDTYDDIVLTIRSIVSNFPEKKYRNQIENIRKGRVIFEPKYLSKELKEIIGT